MRGVGYEAVKEIAHNGSDHLPVMIRKTGWTWRGDYYDPEMPPSVELHFRFWNAQRSHRCQRPVQRPPASF